MAAILSWAPPGPPVKAEKNEVTCYATSPVTVRAQGHVLSNEQQEGKRGHPSTNANQTQEQ